jgi:hypothetical protein
MGAHELRADKIEHTEVTSAGLAAALTITQLFDSIAIRINGPKAWGERLSIGWHFTDTHENYRMELSNGALVHYPTTGNHAADLSVTLTKPQLLQLPGNRHARRHRHLRRRQRAGTADLTDRPPSPRLPDRHPLNRRVTEHATEIAVHNSPRPRTRSLVQWSAQPILCDRLPAGRCQR